MCVRVCMHVCVCKICDAKHNDNKLHWVPGRPREETSFKVIGIGQSHRNRVKS